MGLQTTTKMTIMLKLIIKPEMKIMIAPIPKMGMQLKRKLIVKLEVTTKMAPILKVEMIPNRELLTPLKLKLVTMELSLLKIKITILVLQNQGGLDPSRTAKPTRLIIKRAKVKTVDHQESQMKAKTLKTQLKEHPTSDLS